MPARGGTCSWGMPGGEPPWDQVHPSWDQVHPPDQVHSPELGTPPKTRCTPTPWEQVPPGTRYTPPGSGTPPRDQGDTVYARAVRILLECILLYCEYLYTCQEFNVDNKISSKAKLFFLKNVHYVDQNSSHKRSMKNDLRT